MARESSKAAAHPSLARRASMSSLLTLRKLTIKAREVGFASTRIVADLPASGKRDDALNRGDLDFDGDVDVTDWRRSDPAC